MAEKVLMPQLGESVTEGTISKWFVKVGDKVKKYEPLCEVNTDKVNAEIPSTVSGTVTDIVVAEGETVKVGALICSIETSDSGTIDPSVPAENKESRSDATTNSPMTSNRSGKTRYSPAVWNLAQQHDIDLSRLTGTGAGGRVTRKDVLRYLESADRSRQDAERPTAPREPASSSASGAPAPSQPSVRDPYPLNEGDRVIPISNVRKTIAQRMTRSMQEVPHAWMMVEADVTNLVAFRNKVKDAFRRDEGFNLTFFPFFVKAVVEALKEYPMMNSVWAGDKIIVKQAVHMSIAVATDDALYVPVIRDADQKSVYGIAKAIDELARKARAGKLTIEDTTGGTFTCNNTGSFGSIQSKPIINQPQAAILSIETIVKRPVVIDNMIAIRDMVNLCLSLDHRALDGFVCGNFMQSVKRKLESYGPNTKIY